MTELSFYALLVTCVLLTVVLIAKPALIYEFPYLMGSAFTVFIIPQAIILMNLPYTMPPHNQYRVFLMSFLCILMCVVGYQKKANLNTFRKFAAPINEDKFFTIGCIYTALGYLFNFLINRNPDREMTQWTGILSIYYMLSQIIYVGFAIALYSVIKKPSPRNIALTVISGLVPVQLIIFLGRREPTGLMLLTVALSLYYLKNVKPPRIAIAGFIFFAMLITPIIGEYRALAAKSPSTALQELDIVASFKHYYQTGEILELRNAAYFIDATAFSGNYHFGAGYWNDIVFRYVPAQFVGKDFKESLMIGKHNLKVTTFGDYTVPLGSTITGMADSFLEFGYLGCFFFFFVARLFKNLWAVSLESDSPVVKIFYMNIYIHSIKAITHGSITFLPGLIYSWVFLYGVVLYAGEKKEVPEVSSSLS